jgi:hypothetical protein
MNERVKELVELAGFNLGRFDVGSASLLPRRIERFAELVRQDEREACAEIARFAGMHSIADAIMKRGRNMSTKPENIDTSAERVHETDKSVHEPVTTIETACALLRQAHDVLSMSSLPPKREWIGLTDEEIVACGWCDLRFARAIEAKLRERNNG